MLTDPKTLPIAHYGFVSIHRTIITLTFCRLNYFQLSRQFRPRRYRVFLMVFDQFIKFFRIISSIKIDKYETTFERFEISSADVLLIK